MEDAERAEPAVWCKRTRDDQQTGDCFGCGQALGTLRVVSQQ